VAGADSGMIGRCECRNACAMVSCLALLSSREGRFEVVVRECFSDALEGLRQEDYESVNGTSTASCCQ
jgi:hypothetical protein